jgi:hypothetical protein
MRDVRCSKYRRRERCTVYGSRRTVSGCGAVGPGWRSVFEGVEVKPVEKSVDALEVVAGYLSRFVGTG